MAHHPQTAELRGEILNQALPYIQRFRGQTFVIKYGGSAMQSPDAMRGVIRNVLLLQLVGIRCVVVHGGGPEIDALCARLGLEKRTHEGLRVTDTAMMDAVEMALAGRANKALVAEFQSAGGKAVGLSGRDGDLIVARPLSAELGHVGTVVSVNPEPIQTLMSASYVPVICSVATSPKHTALNVNADTAASAIAAELGASKLIVLSDTDGLLHDACDPGSTISELRSSDCELKIASGAVSGGMIPKVNSAIEAVRKGVPAVHLINGGTPNALLLEVFTDAGIGTMIRA